MIDPEYNPPAFPNSVRREEAGMDRNGNSVTNVVQTLEGGMTILDYFAKEAMSMISTTDKNDAAWAYEVYNKAEAMLAERKRRMEGGK